MPASLNTTDDEGPPVHLFDHLIRAQQQGRRDREAEGLGGLAPPRRAARPAHRRARSPGSGGGSCRDGRADEGEGQRPSCGGAGGAEASGGGQFHHPSFAICRRIASSRGISRRTTTQVASGCSPLRASRSRPHFVDHTERVLPDPPNTREPRLHAEFAQSGLGQADRPEAGASVGQRRRHAVQDTRPQFDGTERPDVLLEAILEVDLLDEVTRC